MTYLLQLSHNFSNKGVSNRKYSQKIPPIRTVYQGSESISFLGPKIWNILSDRLKNANSIGAFKMQIKQWKPKNCPCRFARFMFKMSVLFKSIFIDGEEQQTSCKIQVYDFMRF